MWECMGRYVQGICTWVCAGVYVYMGMHAHVDACSDVVVN